MEEQHYSFQLVMAKILLTHQWEENWNLALSLWEAEISFYLLYDNLFCMNS